MSSFQFKICPWNESGISIEGLTQFLATAGEQLPDPFSRREVKIDVCEYTHKLIKYGIVYLVLDSENNPVGIMGFYANDYVTNIGYLSIISLLTKARGAGIAGKLVKILCERCHSYGMKSVTLKVHKTNDQALNLYKRHGFLCIDETCDKIIMSRQLDTFA